MLQRQLCLILNRQLSAAMFALFMQVEYANNKLFFNLLITMMTKDHTLVTFEFPHDALLSNRFDLQHLFSPIQCQFLILQFCLQVKKSKLEYEVTPQTISTAPSVELHEWSSVRHLPLHSTVFQSRIICCCCF